MKNQYFIKRGEKIHGPFTSSQITTGLQQKKLSGNDLIACKKSGPWESLGQRIEPSEKAQKSSLSVDDEVSSWLQSEGKGDLDMPQSTDVGESIKQVDSEVAEHEVMDWLADDSQAPNHSRQGIGGDLEQDQGNSASCLFESDEIRIEKSNITATKIATLDANGINCLAYDRSQIVSVKKVSALSLQPSVRTLPGEGKFRGTINLGIGVAGFGLLLIVMFFWFLSDDADIDAMWGVLFIGLVPMFIGVMMIFYGGLGVSKQARTMHMLSLTVGSERITIPFKVKADALKAQEVIQKLI